MKHDYNLMVRAIFDLQEKGWTLLDIAILFDVHRNTILNIVVTEKIKQHENTKL